MTTVAALLHNDFFVVEGDDDREEFDRNFRVTFCSVVVPRGRRTTRLDKDRGGRGGKHGISFCFFFTRSARFKELSEKNFHSLEFSLREIVTDRFSSDESDFF